MAGRGGARQPAPKRGARIGQPDQCCSSCILGANLILISARWPFIVGRRVAGSGPQADQRSRVHACTCGSWPCSRLVAGDARRFSSPWSSAFSSTRGVDQWFSQNVQSSVENGAVDRQAPIFRMCRPTCRRCGSAGHDRGSTDQRPQPLFDDRIQFNDALAQIGDIFGYPAIYILDGPHRRGAGASGEAPGAPPYLAPPRSYSGRLPSEGGRAADGQMTQHPDTVRSLIALPAYGDAYLYLVRPLQDGLVARDERNGEPVDSVAYREAQESRQPGSNRPSFSAIWRPPCWSWLERSGWACRRPAAISAPIGRLVEGGRSRWRRATSAARVDSDGRRQVKSSHPVGRPSTA